MDKEIVVYTHTHTHTHTHTQNGILLSHEKECIRVSSDEVDEPRTIQSDVSQKGNDKYHILMHIYGI